jgi:hypothetical protein
METTNETVVPNHYNPNQIVTYKIIDAEANEADIANWYPTVKVSDLEWQLNQHRIERRELNRYSKHVAMLESRLSDYLDMDAEEIVSDICSIFGFNPSKEIEFEGTISFSGTISVPLSDVSDFDIDSIQFNVDIDSDDGDVMIYNSEVDNVTTL